MSQKKIIFVTGTDTGVGKTLFTSLLLHYFRKQGANALAMKPFCSGGMQDVRLLQSLQPGELSNAEMNPYYFPEPVAPLVAAKKGARPLTLTEVVRTIKSVAGKYETLIVEGSGGLMVPLGKNFMVADLIAKLNCEAVVVCRNRLGTINHTMLTVNALKSMGVSARKIKVVMMSGKKTDPSCKTNAAVLGKLLRKKVFQVPFLGLKASSKKIIEAKSGILSQF